MCGPCTKRGLDCSVAQHVQRNKVKKQSSSPPASQEQEKDALIIVLQARIAVLEAIIKANHISLDSPANVVVPPFLFPFPDPFAIDTTGNLSSLDVEASLALENLVRTLFTLLSSRPSLGIDYEGGGIRLDRRIIIRIRWIYPRYRVSPMRWLLHRIYNSESSAF